MFTWLLLTGCMHDMITEEIISRPDFIGFSSTTTRAAVVDLKAMQDDGNGFSVYATGGHNPQRWYADDEGIRIDGMNNYRYASSQWAFRYPVKWPAEADDYPMNFYAFYPADPEGLTVMEDFSSGTKLQGRYTVQEAGRQVDLLAAKATTNSKPATGHLTLSFNHILSRINFGVIAGNGTAPFVQSVKIANVGDTRTYDFVKGTWDTSPSAVTGNASYYYRGAPDGSSIKDFTPFVKDETTANPIYTGIHDNHLMLMPQTSKSWKPQKGMAPDATSGAYISVIYRMSTGNGTNGFGNTKEVGFADAKDHPDNAGGSVTGPLFVKAGFPISSGNFQWEKGNGYT